MEWTTNRVAIAVSAAFILGLAAGVVTMYELWPHLFIPELNIPDIKPNDSIGPIRDCVKCLGT